MTLSGLLRSIVPALLVLGFAECSLESARAQSEGMQVKAKINESRINLVREGLPVAIRIDAFGDMELGGVVTKVNKYAEAGNWWSSSAKEYVTLVEIVDPPPQIRVGLTAEVQILVEHRDVESSA